MMGLLLLEWMHRLPRIICADGTKCKITATKTVTSMQISITNEMDELEGWEGLLEICARIVYVP